MPINGYFSWIFDQFFTFFIDCGHIHVPKGTWCWVFFYFGVHCSWLGMAQKRFILDQNWPNMAGLSTFQSGPKGIKMVNPSVFHHSGPFWAHLDRKKSISLDFDVHVLFVLSIDMLYRFKTIFLTLLKEEKNSYNESYNIALFEYSIKNQDELLKMSLS